MRFEGESDILRPDSLEILDRAVTVMNRYPDVRIEIVGHIGFSATPTSRRDPSLRRAQTVKRYLVEHGVDHGRIETFGFGREIPVASGNSATAIDRNSRIEFLILIPEQPAP